MPINIAHPSPWIDQSGVIHWYAGNTFQLIFEIEITNAETGEVIQITPTDDIVVNFVTRKEQQQVHRFFFNYIQNNSILLDFTPSVTKKFPAGEYEMGITKNGAYVQTLVPFNRVVVERVV